MSQSASSVRVVTLLHDDSIFWFGTGPGQPHQKQIFRRQGHQKEPRDRLESAEGDTTCYIPQMTSMLLFPEGCPRHAVCGERMGTGWSSTAIIAGIVDLLAANQRERITSIISRKNDS